MHTIPTKTMRTIARGAKAKPARPVLRFKSSAVPHPAHAEPHGAPKRMALVHRPKLPLR